MRNPRLTVTALVATAALTLTACGGDTESDPTGGDTSAPGTTGAPTDPGTTDPGATDPGTTEPPATTEPGATPEPGGSAALPKLDGQTIEVAAVWSGTEQENFRKVLAEFEKQTGAKVTYTSTGDDIATVLAPRVEGGQAPDVAILPQPGLLTQFANAGSLKPVSNEVSSAIDANYAPVWKDLGSVDGKVYGVWFKAANKSTVWYNVKAFVDAGVTPPTTWDEFVTASQTLADSGVTPISVAGADGWTLTDWFENVYLSQAGPEMYDKLTKHEIPWTDPSVKTALETLAQVWGQEGFIAAGAQQTDFPGSVSQVFSESPKAAMVYEGDFVAGVISGETTAKVGTDANFFPFPQVGDAPAVVGGGDVAVAFKDSDGAQAMMQFLASPEAANIWIEAGGFTSPNKSADLALYPDDVSRSIAESLVNSDSFRFDMSDQVPPAFGGTKGKGMWKDLADFLADPSDVDGAMKALEANAKAADKK